MEYLPKELQLVVRVDEWEEREDPNDSDSDGGGDSEDEEDCEITHNEELEPVRSARETSIAVSSQKHGAFHRAFIYQRGVKPSKRTLFKGPRKRRE